MNSNEIHYKISWRSKGNFPGHHPSQQPGGGLQFRNHVNLIDAPDPRRFDIRASIRDPFRAIESSGLSANEFNPGFLSSQIYRHRWTIAGLTIKEKLSRNLSNA